MIPSYHFAINTNYRIAKARSFFGLLLLMVLQITPVANAGELVLVEGLDRYQASQSLDILEDVTGELQLADVISQEYSDKFFDPGKTIPSFGITSSVYWARLHLKNEQLREKEWYLGSQLSGTTINA